MGDYRLFGKEIEGICLDFSKIENYAISIVREKFKDTDYDYYSLTIGKEDLELAYQSKLDKTFKFFKVTYEEIARNNSKMENFSEQRKTISQRDKEMLENKIELLKEDIECIHMYFNEQKKQVPNEIDGKELSIIGKIKYLIGEF